jgi:hypothetical protein
LGVLARKISPETCLAFDPRIQNQPVTSPCRLIGSSTRV